MRTLVAILAMSSCAAFAQTHSPAQPASTPTLQASLYRSAAFTATPPAPAAAVAHNSTGVIAPRLLHAAPFAEVDGDVFKNATRARSVVLDFTIDATGKPCAMKVLQSNDPFVNVNVMRAIGDSQYQPATLDGVAVPMHVKMTYNINPNRQD